VRKGGIPRYAVSFQLNLPQAIFWACWTVGNKVESRGIAEETGLAELGVPGTDTAAQSAEGDTTGFWARERLMELLIVDDNPADVRLAQEAIKMWDKPVRVSVVWDGEQALEFLGQRGDFEQAPRPDLVLLDLNLPRKTGREVLDVIKNDESLKQIPVVVMTTSNAQEDIESVYGSHGNCFITKASQLNDFLDTMQSIYKFWFESAELPDK